jgi:acyl-CoA synthetase (AMP-forming)/AMP-acid ligase II
MSAQDVPMDRFNRRINAAMTQFRDRTAFEGASTKTFTEMEAAVGCAEAWLEAHGLGRGDRVAALTTNRIETVALEWAAYRLGGIWIGVPARERDPANLKQVLGDFSPRLLVVEEAAIDLWRDATLLPLGDYSKEVPPPAIFDPSRYRALERTAGAPDAGKFSVQDACGTTHPIVRIRYTSGASGEPRAVAYSAETSLAILEQISALLDEELKVPSRPWDLAMIQGLPIVWATGSLIAPVFCRGGKNTLLPRWDLKAFVHAVAREKRVLAFLTPGLLTQLAAYSESSGAGWAEAPKRFQVLVAGAPLPVSTMLRVKAALPNKVEFYVTLGQTEASFPITWHQVEPQDVHQKERPFIPLGGLASPYEESEIDEKSRELRLRGRAVAPGRWVRSTEGSGCWEPLPSPHATGDLVDDEGGILHYLGRAGVVPNPGKLPAPEAVEAVVNECPGVERSRLDYCGGGERVLTVQPAGSGVRKPSLRRFFNEGRPKANLSHFRLHEIRFGDVPLTMTGKVSREKKLREEACAETIRPERTSDVPGANQALTREHRMVRRIEE